MLPRLPSPRETLFPPEASGYRELAQIGRGGMAEIVLAERLTPHAVDRERDTRLVVLKRIWPAMLSTPGFLSLFRHEARVGLGFHHPNIVRTHALLEQPQGPAIALEYLDGQTLARVLNRLVGPQALTLAMRIQIVLRVLDALEHAHGLADKQRGPLGIVHRDVSPHNVLITYAGAIKLVDFGVAQSIDSDTAQLSALGTAGKIAYMAPEQLLGARVDRRADLFSVGVMLWEVVAGRRLWRGMTDEAIVRHLTRGLPTPALPAELSIPDDLRQIISRALAVSVKNRYGSASELANDLAPTVRGSDEPHTRHLGHLISLAFANEKAARQVLIAGHLGGTKGVVPPPLPEAARLRAPRPTPSGLWSRTLSLTSIGRAWAGPRWMNVGLSALGATCLLAAAFGPPTILAWRARHAGSATSAPLLALPAPAQAHGSPIIVAPLRARSIIPWPLPWGWNGADRQATATADSATALAHHTDRLRKRSRARATGTEGESVKGRRAARDRDLDASTRTTEPRTHEADDDNILAPSMDLSPTETTVHRPAAEHSPARRPPTPPRPVR